jgi:hypothetical protein
MKRSPLAFLTLYTAERERRKESDFDGAGWVRSFYFIQLSFASQVCMNADFFIPLLLLLFDSLNVYFNLKWIVWH